MGPCSQERTCVQERACLQEGWGLANVTQTSVDLQEWIQKSMHESKKWGWGLAYRKELAYKKRLACRKDGALLACNRQASMLQERMPNSMQESKKWALLTAKNLLTRKGLLTGRMGPCSRETDRRRCCEQAELISEASRASIPKAELSSRANKQS